MMQMKLPKACIACNHFSVEGKISTALMLKSIQAVRKTEPNSVPVKRMVKKYSALKYAAASFMTH